MPLAVPCALLLLALLLLPWGPGNHLEFAERVWRRRRELLPMEAATVLGEHKHAYFYGNIAADIINFKGYGGHYNHCHRWTVIDDMRSIAETSEEEAFILGYLSHLAADTIAHNHFVPYHLARYARTRGLGHLYWEMNADRFVPESRWAVIGALKTDRGLHRLDELINRVVARKALSMRTNKLIFNHVLLISEGDRWRKGVARLHPLSRVNLSKGFLELFRRAAVARVQLALRPRGLRRLLHVDTNGKIAQREAIATRRRVLRDTPPGAPRRDQSEELAAVYLEGMESPPPPPPDGAVPHWE